MSLLLEGLGTTQIILIVLIGLLVIAYPLLMLRRNKKENQRMTEQTNSLKRGDKILTSTGVYGKIIDIKMDGTAKQVTIETGSDKYKSYMTIDAYAIYQVIKDEPKVAKDLPKEETAEPQVAQPKKKASKKQIEPAEKEAAPQAETEPMSAEVKPEENPPAKKSKKSSK